MTRYALYPLRFDTRDVLEAPSISALRAMLWGHGSCKVYRINKSGSETYMGTMKTDGSYYAWYTPSGKWYYSGNRGQLTDYYTGRVRY